MEKGCQIAAAVDDPLDCHKGFRLIVVVDDQVSVLQQHAQTASDIIALVPDIGKISQPIGSRRKPVELSVGCAYIVVRNVQPYVEQIGARGD
jgi:hypothetical protein